MKIGEKKALGNPTTRFLRIIRLLQRLGPAKFSKTYYTKEFKRGHSASSVVKTSRSNLSGYKPFDYFDVPTTNRIGKLR